MYFQHTKTKNVYSCSKKDSEEILDQSTTATQQAKY